MTFDSKCTYNYRITHTSHSNSIKAVLVVVCHTPDSWRDWSEPHYGQTGSPEPSLGRPFPAKKLAANKSEKTHFISTKHQHYWKKCCWNAKDCTLVILTPSFFLPLFTAAKLCRALSKSTSFLSRFAMRAWKELNRY